MKSLLAGSAITLLCVSAYATAGCDAPALDGAGIVAAFGGNTVCGTPTASYTGNPSDRWQEAHVGDSPAGGELIDYKLGPDDPVDPSKTVGSWQVEVGVEDPNATEDPHGTEDSNGTEET